MTKINPEHSIQKPTCIKVPKRTYQPRRKELREEIDMPGMSYEETRKAFCRPFKFESD